jgi:hypothetical protein
MVKPMKNVLKKLGLAAVALMLVVVPATADTYNSFGTWSGAVGGPVNTMNFNGVAVGGDGWTSVSSGTTISGVTFSTGLNSQISVANSGFDAFALYSVNGGSQALTATLCSTCGDGDFLQIDFNHSVRGFGMDMNVFTVPFTIKLSNGQSFTITAGGMDLFFGTANTSSFTWARIYSPFPIIGSVSWVNDTQVFTNDVTTNTVPEPASLFLLGTGLIGSAAGIKRRFKKA